MIIISINLYKIAPENNILLFINIPQQFKIIHIENMSFSNTS